VALKQTKLHSPKSAIMLKIRIIMTTVHEEFIEIIRKKHYLNKDPKTRVE
jgi:hypothetical protein